jgi:hypothetical protein
MSQRRSLRTVGNSSESSSSVGSDLQTRMETEVEDGGTEVDSEEGKGDDTYQEHDDDNDDDDDENDEDYEDEGEEEEESDEDSLLIEFLSVTEERLGLFLFLGAS